MNDDAVNRLIDELGATQILLAKALIELEYLAGEQHEGC